MNNYRNRKMEVLCNKAFLYVVSHRCNARTTIKIFLFLLHKGKHNVVGKVASLNCGKKIHFLRKCEVLGPFLEWASQFFPISFVLKQISVLMLTSQKLNICKNFVGDVYKYLHSLFWDFLIFWKHLLHVKVIENKS